MHQIFIQYPMYDWYSDFSLPFRLLNTTLSRHSSLLRSCYLGLTTFINLHNISTNQAQICKDVGKCRHLENINFYESHIICTKYISTFNFVSNFIYERSPLNVWIGRNTCLLKGNGHNKSENDQYVVANVWLMESRPLGPFICLFVHTTMR